MPSAASGSTGSEPEQPNQDKGRASNRARGCDPLSGNIGKAVNGLTTD
jgi:hypothetical protein